MSISHSLNTESEPYLESDPIDEVKAAYFESFIEPNLEDDAQFFIEEEDDQPRQPLDPFEEPPKPTIELKPLPSGFRYIFLNNDPNTPVIISDKLSQEETFCLITVLEKHRSAFGYSLQYLKGINPALCTHRIPIDPDVLPSRELQRRLNNAIREVVKKEVFKLLHARIIYPVPLKGLDG
jgi:hypothetical protein